MHTLKQRRAQHHHSSCISNVKLFFLLFLKQIKAADKINTFKQKANENFKKHLVITTYNIEQR